jgi:predicted nucleotide-binding protein
MTTPPANAAAKYTRRPFPADSLEEAIVIATAIQEQNNGRPMNRILLAKAIGRKPASSQFVELLSSSFKYGLTLGTEKAESISLTELGLAITKPRSADERIAAIRGAALVPELLKRIYEHYNNGKLPSGDFFSSVLERDFGVPRDRCQECADLVLRNGSFAQLLQEVNRTLYVILSADGYSPTSRPLEEVPNPGGDDEQSGAANREASEPSAPRVPQEKFIFIGHGRNHTPLQQLEKALTKLGLPIKVAIDEPQIFRPISAKVAEIMHQCHAAILIFTADEELQRKDGTAVWRPSENVIYELGAASVLYGKRIVIFKEDGIEFPANFKDIGYISFEKDRLDSKEGALLTELIALGLIKLQVA